MKTSENTNEFLESTSLSGWPAEEDSDSSITSFEKWLKKESKLSSSKISNLVCFIRLKRWKGHPACYLVLSKPDKRDDSILTDSEVLGNLWVWPMLESEISKANLFMQIENDFKSFTKSCQTKNCIFFAAKKVVFGYRNDDYKELSIK